MAAWQRVQSIELFALWVRSCRREQTLTIHSFVAVQREIRR
jgi:hypothetical protein